MPNELRKEINKYRWRQNHYWKLLVSAYSIIYGYLYIRAGEFGVTQFDPILIFLPETPIGIGMIVFSLIFVLHIYLPNKYLFNIGLLGLSFLWGGLFITASWFAFTHDYPASIWLDKFLIVAICLKLVDYRFEVTG